MSKYTVFLTGIITGILVSLGLKSKSKDPKTPNKSQPDGRAPEDEEPSSSSHHQDGPKRQWTIHIVQITFILIGAIIGLISGAFEKCDITSDLWSTAGVTTTIVTVSGAAEWLRKKLMGTNVKELANQTQFRKLSPGIVLVISIILIAVSMYIYTMIANWAENCPTPPPDPTATMSTSPDTVLPVAPPPVGEMNSDTLAPPVNPDASQQPTDEVNPDGVGQDDSVTKQGCQGTISATNTKISTSPEGLVNNSSIELTERELSIIITHQGTEAPIEYYVFYENGKPYILEHIRFVRRSSVKFANQTCANDLPSWNGT